MTTKEIIASDLKRYRSELKYNNVLAGFIIPGFRYSYFLRKSTVYPKQTFLGLLYRIILNIYSSKYGYQINPSTKIGKGLYLGHRGSIIINSQSIIGDYCNLSPGVTIGQTNRGIRKGAPRLGNKVWVGTNAVIVGGITIGDNVLIAPNAFVNHDVPSNSIVIGNPAQIIQKENATEGYIEFIS